MAAASLANPTMKLLAACSGDALNPEQVQSVQAAGANEV